MAQNHHNHVERIALIRVIPTLTYHSDIRSGVLDIYSDILSDIYSDIFSGILADISFDILSSILSDILSDVLRDILHSQLRSRSAHSDLALAVEVGSAH